MPLMIRLVGIVLILMSLPLSGAFAQPAPDACAVFRQPLPGAAGTSGEEARAALLLTRKPGIALAFRPSRESACRLRRPEAATVSGGEERAADDRLDVIPFGALDVIWNSAYPSGGGHGMLWPGRGASTQLTAGITLRLGPVSLSLLPSLAYQENRDFEWIEAEFPERSRFAYPWTSRIDWPIRHGDEAFGSVGPGQSFARVDFRYFGAGVSTENLWWGPGTRNAILLGNDAPGFPHVFLGSGSGWPSPVGVFDAELLWGRLSESDFFDDDGENDLRMFSGIVLSWQPRGATGLTLGAARIFIQRYQPGSLQLGDFLPFFESPLKGGLQTPENPRGNDEADQLAGLFVRYALPGSGFEVFGEWARNDHSLDMQDFFAEPEHSHAYTLGFQQLFGIGATRYRVRGELTNLNPTMDTRSSFPRWYSHGRLQQGYTHEGQVLGAWIGPGSDAQYLGVDAYTGGRRHGLHVQRVRYDEDTYFLDILPAHGRHGHDVELTVGTTHGLAAGPLDITAGLTISSRRNRNFRLCSPDSPPLECGRSDLRELNWHVPIGVVWRPDR